MLTLSLYEGSRYVRVTNAQELKAPPQAIYTKLKGASDFNSDCPHQRMYMAILERFIFDLSFCGDAYMTEEAYYLLREARIDFKFTGIWYARFLGLEPDYIRRVLKENGYMPEVRWRRVSRERTEHFGLTERIKELERGNWEAHCEKRSANAKLMRTVRQQLAQQQKDEEENGTNTRTI